MSVSSVIVTHVAKKCLLVCWLFARRTSGHVMRRGRFLFALKSSLFADRCCQTQHKLAHLVLLTPEHNRRMFHRRYSWCHLWARLIGEWVRSHHIYSSSGVVVFPRNVRICPNKMLRKPWLLWGSHWPPLNSAGATAVISYIWIRWTISTGHEEVRCAHLRHGLWYTSSRWKIPGPCPSFSLSHFRIFSPSIVIGSWHHCSSHHRHWHGDQPQLPFLVRYTPNSPYLG